MKIFFLMTFFVCGFSYANDAVFTFDCDAKDDLLPMFTLELQKAPFQLNTYVTQLKKRPDGKAWPMANIYIDGEGADQSAGLRFVAIGESGNEMNILLFNEKKYGRGQFKGKSTTGGINIPIEIKLATNTLSIKVANLPEIHEKLNFQPKKLSLLCAAGSYTFISNFKKIK